MKVCMICVFHCISKSNRFPLSSRTKFMRLNGFCIIHVWYDCFLAGLLKILCVLCQSSSLQTIIRDHTWPTSLEDNRKPRMHVLGTSEYKFQNIVRRCGWIVTDHAIIFCIHCIIVIYHYVWLCYMLESYFIIQHINRYNFVLTKIKTSSSKQNSCARISYLVKLLLLIVV